MEHQIRVEAYGTRLRPVTMDDAAFIVGLRNLDHAKGRVGDSATDVNAQRAWLEKYFARPGDYYFIIETLSGTAVGAYGIYDVTGDSAESGRWVIRPGVSTAIPSAMLAFDVAFGPLKMRELRVKTVSTNQPVLSLNRKFGFRQVRVEENSAVIGGVSVAQIHFLLDGKDWPGVRKRLEPLAKLAEKDVLQWDKDHPREQNLQ